MSDVPDDLRRRMESMETMQGDMRLIMRDTVANSGRLNEILLELKEDLKEMRDEMKALRSMELDVANLKIGFTAIKWLATTVGGAAVMMVLAYLFKTTGGL